MNDGYSSDNAKVPSTDPERLIAASRAVEELGGSGFEAGQDADGWWASIEHGDDVVKTAGHETAESAAESVARRFAKLFQCDSCKKPIRLGGPRHHRSRVCRWRRMGAQWIRRCQLVNN